MSSRTTTTTAIQAAIADPFPRSANRINAPQTITLSTSGSKILPNRVICPNRLAHQPSIQSVDAATRKSSVAPTKRRCSISTNNPNARSSLSADSVLGTFQTWDDSTDGCMEGRYSPAGTPARS